MTCCHIGTGEPNVDNDSYCAITTIAAPTRHTTAIFLHIASLGVPFLYCISVTVYFFVVGGGAQNHNERSSLIPCKSALACHADPLLHNIPRLHLLLLSCFLRHLRLLFFPHCKYKAQLILTMLRSVGRHLHPHPHPSRPLPNSPAASPAHSPTTNPEPQLHSRFERIRARRPYHRLPTWLPQH